QDLGKAEDMYGRAAALGHLQAADNFGLLMFQRGEQARAIPYITAAADRGEPRAQYLLGIAHFNGQLVAKDWVRAYALVSLAQQAGVGPAVTALKQMDGYIPLDQRQQAVALASELQSRSEASRNRQVAAADLGTVAPATPPTARSVLGAATPRPPLVADASGAVAAAQRAAGADSPATAGADYARPAVARPVTAPPKPAPVAAALTAPSRTAQPKASAVAAPATGGSWRIQLGAFGVAANGDALWAKVRGRPELAAHPRINAKAGAITKLQVGGYANEASALAACAKLKASGQTCIAVTN
ncbi:MAG: SPOR domain-containing protein, partial [Sphingomonadales bacterium]|nr:SPOR domain-containing protein [Sphingomonadales bacterium]